MSRLNDTHYMRAALSLARRGLGRTAPNPSVGCVIVRDGVVVGRGRTADGGRPHAEVAAIADAGAQARGATAYVSLEPCAHVGKTGPCAQALVEAGIARCVIACEDPDERVSGRGVEILRDAGIEGEVGVLAAEALALNAGFILSVTEARPFITLKIATSADYKIAAGPGERTQISGALAGRYMHLERSRHDAILVGANTARVDAPLLTTRIDGYAHESLRVVLDKELHVGEERVDVDVRDLGAVMAALVERGVTRLLVEGGAKVHRSFIDAGLADRFLWVKSPMVIGTQGVDAIDGLDIAELESFGGLETVGQQMLGEDELVIFERKG